MIGSPLLIAEKARARLSAVLAASRSGADSDDGEAQMIDLPDPSDLVISACEVNAKHGTGTLLLRIFEGAPSIVSLRTHNFYDSDQSFGEAALCLPLAQSGRTEISSWLRWYLAGTTVRRILCLPYTPSEVNVALAAREMSGAPLCTYIMDDKNVCADGISDALMQELLARSRLRLVIGPEMRDAYEKKYRMRFWVAPPVVKDEIIARTPVEPPTGADANRIVLLGNIWGQRWLDELRGALRGSGLTVDWYCNQQVPSGLSFDRAKLAADGIRQLDPIGEENLPKVLGQYAMALVPSDTLDGESPAAVRAIAELSLPSRMLTLLCCAHLPMLVLGSPNTCASRFVRRFELGETQPYELSAIRSGIAALLAAERAAGIRARATALAPRFTAKGVADWIWRSLEEGKAATLDYEAMMPKEADAGALKA